MNTIDRLLNSWDNVNTADGFCPQKLFLASRDGELRFEPKVSKSFFERVICFFMGEPEDESFRVQVAKIKAIFASLSENITDEERARCTRLEERINSLGRYVFARRSAKTLFCCFNPKLAEFQIRAFCQNKVLIPPDLIKRSLSNFGQTCWLNAALKFLTGTCRYDSMLTKPRLNLEIEALRLAFFRIIEALRKNWDQYVVDALHSELIDELRSSNFSSFLNGQQDADDFIFLLENYFTTKKTKEIFVAKIYTSFTDNVCKNGSIHEGDKLQISPQGDEVIDIDECFTRPEVAENLNEYFVGNIIQKNASPLLFGMHNYVLGYPDSLEIIQRRTIVDYNSRLEKGHVSSPKFKLNDDGTITLTEYEPVITNNLLLGVQKKALCTFKITAAVERLGSSSGQGHYIAHLRSLHDGVISTHDDANITYNQPESVWENAYWLALQLIKRVNVDAF